MKRYISHNSINESLFISNIIPNGVEDIGSSAFANCPLKTIYIDKDNEYVIKKFERLGYKDNIKLIDNKVNESLSIPIDSSADDDYLYDMNYKQYVEDNYDIKKDKDDSYYVYPKYNKPSIDLTKYFKDLNYYIHFKLSKEFKERYKDEYINPNIIPNGVEYIYSSVFAGCSKLESIIIPNSVENIYISAFAGCSKLESITIPNSVEYIYGSAFAGCSSLESITIPNSVKYIYSSAFANCSKLESIIIPNSVKSIDYSAFENCSSLTSITIPNSVEDIGISSFANCSSLESITIPNSIKNIDDSTFAGCSSLESITIPNSVKYISNSAFENCPLKTIYIDKDNKYAINYFKELGYKDNIKLIDNKVNESLSIPIDSSADDDYLYDMNYKQYVEDNYYIEKDKDDSYYVSPKYNKPSIDLTKYFKDLNYYIHFKLSKEFKERYKDEYINPNIIPNGVEYIYSSVFAGCSKLESIIIPNSVENIYISAFAGCSKLESITIPNSVENIYSSAFANCSSLESITIPNSVKYISNSAFAGCSKLESIIIPNSVEYIYSSVFAGCSKLKSITIPNSVKEIYSSAFANCSSLESISIPNSVKYIYSSAFANCPKLKDINIDKDNKYAINYFKELRYEDNIKLIDNDVNESLSIPIDSSADDDYLYDMNYKQYVEDNYYIEKDKHNSYYVSPKYNKPSIDLTKYFKDLDYDSLIYFNLSKEFKERYKDEDINPNIIPNGVKYIDSSAFAGCSKLESISIPNSVKYIGSSAFENCSSLESISIPNSVEIIYSSVFAGCSSLESISIPNSVGYIGNSAFAGCSSLESITIPNSVKYIDDLTFDDRPLKTIYIDKDNEYVIKKFERLGYKDNIKLIDNKVNESLSIPIDSSADDDYLYDMNYKQYVESNYYIEKDNYGYYVYPKYNKPSIDLTKYFKDLDYDSFIYFKLSKEFKERYKDEDINPNIIPNGVKYIGSSAFENCSSLESISIPNSVKEIYSSVFAGCSSLESISIPNSVKEIYNSAFAGCSSLESITIPNSVKEIYSSAFANCSSLESISIPNSVKYIYSSAFANCPKLKDINIDKDNKYAINYFKELGYEDNIKLIDNDVNESLSIPTDSSADDDYLYDMNYKKLVEERYDIIYSQLSENFTVSPKTNEKSIDLTKYFEGRERVNIIFKLTEDFEIKYKDEILNSDIIPNGVEKILKDTFVNIKQSIENINIPDSVDYISNDTFSNCSELKSIKLSEKLDNIPDRCFMNCIKLESIEIPDKVQTIGEYAFNNCKSLESITLSNNIYEIGVYAFDKCDKINEITIKEVIPNFKINDYIENHFKCYGCDIEIQNA